MHQVCISILVFYIFRSFHEFLRREKGHERSHMSFLLYRDEADFVQHGEVLAYA